MTRAQRLAWLFVFCLTTIAGRADAVDIAVVAEGLYYPAGMALLPDGSVLIAEAGGHGERSAGISLLRPDGALGRLISGLPNSFSRDNLLSAPVIAASPAEAAILVGVAGGGLYSLPLEKARQLPDEPYRPGDLQRRQAARGSVFLLHPFDIALDERGMPLVSDAAGNGLVREDANGALRYVHRFPAMDSPRHDGGRLDALPTGLTQFQGATYAALFGGCPHVLGGGELVSLNGAGEQRTIADGLNMPIDVAADAAGNLWLLEFAAFAPRDDCFGALQRGEASGTLSRLDASGLLETVAEGLYFPAALLPLPDGSLYISEPYAGRVLRLRFDGKPPPPQRYPPVRRAEPDHVELRDLDDALRRVIEQHELAPYPGRELQEPDSELARLGRDLFFDPILSGDQNIACATCHHPDFAMADGRALPIGAGGMGLGEERAFRKLVSAASGETELNPFIGEFIPRNSPTIINSALLPSQFWDGRVEQDSGAQSVHTLEDAINDLDLRDPLLAQVLFPITSRHEMAGLTFGSYPPMVIRLSLLERLRDNANYAGRFERIFGGEPLSIRQLGEAIAAFERQLVFTASPWDDYMAGDQAALSEGQKRGALLFYGALNREVNCAQCHSGPLLTDMDFHNLLVPQLGPGKDNGEDGKDDFGRANVSFDYRDQYRFRTPSLRNVELTAPYFHSGAYRSLSDVVWHHADPWRANITYAPDKELPPELRDQLLPYDFARQAHSVAFPMQAGMPLRDDEVADLVAFMLALTDPAARDLSHITPTQLPSGLPLDRASS